MVEYDYDVINNIDPSFTEAFYNKFFEREGDYFLHKLIYLNVDVANRFYFLTAYAFADEIRGADDIIPHILFNQFRQNNFIEKGNNEAIERLRAI